MLLTKSVLPPLCELCMRPSVVSIGNVLSKCLYISSQYGYPISAQLIRNSKKLASSSSVRYVFLPLLVFIWTFRATLSCNVDFVLFSKRAYAHFACLHILAFLICAGCAVFCVTGKVPKCSDNGEVHIQSILAVEPCNSWLQQCLPNWWTQPAVSTKGDILFIPHCLLLIHSVACYCRAMSVSERNEANDHIPFEILLCI